MTALISHKRFLLLFSLFLSISFVVCGQVKTRSPLAYKYFNDMEWAKAAPIFLEMYEANKLKSYLKYYIRCLVELKDFKTAEKELKKAQRQTGDISYYIDLAYISQMQKNRKKADDYLEKPFNNFPQSVATIKSLGQNYMSYRKFDHALRVFQIGRTVLNMPDEFRMDMANLYGMQHMTSEMLDEYIALLLTQPVYINTVQNYLRSALTRDIDENILDLTQQKTLNYIQQFPGLTVFSELLIWVYIQKNEFDLAVDQAISLDIRSRDSGMRTLRLARTARQSGDYQSSERAYDYLIDKGPVKLNANRNVNRPNQDPYSQALVERNQTVLSRLEESSTSLRSDYNSLFKSYQFSASILRDPLQKASQLKDMAYLSAFYLSDVSSAIKQIDSAMTLSISNKQFHADCMLDKADYQMISGQPWEATFLYARVDKENKNNPTGSIAKLRKAQLAYFTGDFTWALSQLNVLRGSSSKLVANDAFELSMLIRSNQTREDSLNMALTEISRAEYFLFQKRIPECVALLDSIINTNNHSLVQDDALFMKAEILFNKGDIQNSKILFRKISQEFRYEIWGHKALYRLGELYYHEDDMDKAAELFEELIIEFPNSFYNLDARNYLKEIRDQSNS